MANSAAPDQLASKKKPTDLDLHCLQRQGNPGSTGLWLIVFYEAQPSPLFLIQCQLHIIDRFAKIVLRAQKKSGECHNHKPQPFPDIKRKRKQTKQNKCKSNKRTKSTKISSLFPKRCNRNAKRTEKKTTTTTKKNTRTKHKNKTQEQNNIRQDETNRLVEWTTKQQRVRLRPRPPS